ncbi:MAG: tyrosine-type recombinase/integrase [Candidatus Sericytochromatia bacterium]|nr:tyrosine-type recombinase/integrase [Candidatus Tanganyikabacteria bacterium]
MAEGRHFRFTKAAIDRLAADPGGKRLTYWDSEVKGLALQVTPKGAKSFYTVRRVRGGGPEWVRIGPFPEITVEQARQAGRETTAKLAAGRSVATQRREERADYTFLELFTWWIDLPGKQGPKSAAYKRNCLAQLDSYLKPIAGRKARTLTRQEIRHLHEAIGRNHGPYAANRTLATVRSVINKSIAHERFSGENPATRIETFPEVSRERRLLPGEVARFLEAVAAEPNADIRDYVLLSLFTGARKSNVLAMRWAQIDLDGGIWHLPTTKNGKPQVIPLGPEELAILHTRRQGGGGDILPPAHNRTLAQKLPKPGNGASSDVCIPFGRPRTVARHPEWVFPSASASGHLAEPKKGWRRILERAQITDLHLHDLRRTLGSFMADAGVATATIGKALNHLSPAATAIYARLSIDPIRQAKEQAVALMLGDRR